MLCGESDSASFYDEVNCFQDDGLWLLYESAMAFFPLDFSRFMRMTMALASASADSAAMVSRKEKKKRKGSSPISSNSLLHMIIHCIFSLSQIHFCLNPREGKKYLFQNHLENGTELALREGWFTCLHGNMKGKVSEKVALTLREVHLFIV